MPPRPGTVSGRSAAPALLGNLLLLPDTGTSPGTGESGKHVSVFVSCLPSGTERGKPSWGCACTAGDHNRGSLCREGCTGDVDAQEHAEAQGRSRRHASAVFYFEQIARRVQTLSSSSCSDTGLKTRVSCDRSYKQISCQLLLPSLSNKYICIFSWHKICFLKGKNHTSSRLKY